MQTEDSFVDELWSAAPASGASLLAALFPRCFIDPNRAPDDVDPEVSWRVSFSCFSCCFLCQPLTPCAALRSLCSTRSPEAALYSHRPSPGLVRSS
jgi:N-formylglutamate amidohydrolase